MITEQSGLASQAKFMLDKSQGRRTRVFGQKRYSTLTKSTSRFLLANWTNTEQSKSQILPYLCRALRIGNKKIAKLQMFMKGEYDQMKETLKIDEALAPSSEDEEDPYIT